MGRRLLACALAAVAPLLLPAPGLPAPPPYVPPAQSIRGIVFDPSDYYATGLSVDELAEMLVARWSWAGVNVIYMNAYNVVFGAHYRTRHPHNRMDGFGRSDLLAAMITAAHRRRMQVFASFYSHTHRGAWMANPSWRAKRADGSDYSPPGVDVQYFLSVWHPEALAWWRGLLQEILTTYPDLDGIELREPIINWWGREADFNPAAVADFRRAAPGQPLGGQAWRRWRAAGLTRFIAQTVRLVHLQGRRIHVTSVASAWGDGRLLTAREQAEQTGFDLDGVLSGPAVPDAVKLELIWQQWGNVYDYATFSPQWTGRAAAAALAMVGGRTRTVIHVELTQFGRRMVTPEETYLAIRAARASGANDFDVYGAGLADEREAWPWLRRAFTEHDPLPAAPAREGPARRVLVLEDVDRDRSGVPRLATRLLMNLLGHFDLTTEVRPVAEYARGAVDEYDAVIYQGTQWDAPLPAALLDDLRRYGGSTLWIGANLWQLTQAEPLERFGLRARPPVPQHTADALRYRGARLQTAALPILGLEVGPPAAVEATAEAAGRRLPLIVRSGRFWFVAGYLFVDPDRNPLHLLVADLLHDVLRTPHAPDRQALVVLTGIMPLTDPRQLAEVHAVTAGRVRPVLSVTPVFVDPAAGVRVPLARRPALVAELQRAVRSGATVVLNGYTHQLRGRTGQDLEFWDAATGMARADDSTGVVTGRVRSALQELLAAGLVPVGWATPGGLASPFDYSLFGEMFSLHLERRFYGFNARGPVRPRFPYLVRADLHGHTVVSPNVDLPDRGHRTAVAAAARTIGAVRDPLLVLSVPVGTPPRALAESLAGLQQEGYRFVDVRDLATIEIRTPELAAASAGGKIRLLVGEDTYLQVTDLTADGRRLPVRTAWFDHPQRYEEVPALPAGALRVATAWHVPPWSARWWTVRAQILAASWEDLWARRDVVGGLQAALLLLSVFSAATVAVLGVAHLLVRLAGRPP